MKNSFRRYSKYALGFFVFIFALSLIHWIGEGGFYRPGEVEAKITNETIIFNEETIALDKANPQIRAVMAIQNRHTPKLLEIPEVVGTATGLTAAGRPAILVLTRNIVRAGAVPESLEGMPVVVQVTGEIFSMKGRPPKNDIDPTARFNRPVPIGVSTGNKGECSAGTIGARVKDGVGNVYALSNNHVYALENSAVLGSNVLQPGLYDTNCIFDSGNIIGQLDEYEPINFGGLNYIDAAIALSSKELLGRATPANGYGTPKAATVPANLGQAVQKYGRTTSLTKGIITGINATVDVTYSSGTARFVDQIVVSSARPFIKAGDSGSLLVTDPGRNPVGLLFAGNGSGKLAIANPIDLVLERFGVAIDGE